LDAERTLLFYIFCSIFLGFVLVRFLFRKEWVIIVESFRNGPLAKTHHQQGNLRFSFPMLLLLAISSMIFAVVILGLSKGFFVQPLDGYDLWKIALITFGLICLRIGLLAAFSFILPDYKSVMLYPKTVAIFSIFLGFAFLPIGLLLSFNSSIPIRLILTFSVIVFGIFVITRFYRGFGIAKPQFITRKDYFFLYFCALEILPIVLIFRAFGII